MQNEGISSLCFEGQYLAGLITAVIPSPVPLSLISLQLCLRCFFFWPQSNILSIIWNGTAEMTNALNMFILQMEWHAGRGAQMTCWLINGARVSFATLFFAF